MFDKAVSFCGQELRYQEVAQTLNVLDYDTYFSMTETLLSGNYVEALLSFDNVLARGILRPDFMQDSTATCATCWWPATSFAPAAGIYRYADGTIPDAAAACLRISFGAILRCLTDRRQIS